MLDKKDIIANLQRNTLHINYGNVRKAAVMVPLIETAQGIEILFEVRAAHLNWQPGDICFPGGKVDAGDKSIVDAALRETYEELGIEAKHIQIYRELPVLPTAFNMAIYPVIGQIHHPHCMDINPDEVEKVFTVPLTWFLANPPDHATMQLATKPDKDFPSQLITDHSGEWQPRATHQVYIYQYNSYTIWGLTAQILHASLTLMAGHNAK